ncbi:hypothetical protein GF407_07245 [candidate division KSB1 bacterium]|nr:hypothetical protein [candidate division KSB1 bacterium]
MYHINDNILQEYFDRQLSQHEQERVEEHIKSCRDCRDKVLMMKTLYDAIEEAMIDSAPPEWIQRVMQTIQKHARMKKRINDLSRISLYIFTALASMGITLYYVNLEKLLNSFSLTKSVSDLVMWDALKNYLQEVNLDISLLIAGIIVIIIIAAIDSVVFQGHWKAKSS